MAVPQEQMKIEMFDFDLIECTRQPGNLKISKQACGRRYILAQGQKSLGPKGHFGVAYHWSLEKCQACPKGRSNAKGLPKKTRSKSN